MKEADSVLGGAVRVLRAAAGWEQTRLARALGVSKSYLSQIENGQRPPTWSLLAKVTSVLGVPLSRLAEAQLLVRAMLALRGSGDEPSQEAGDSHPTEPPMAAPLAAIALTATSARTPLLLAPRGFDLGELGAARLRRSLAPPRCGSRAAPRIARREAAEQWARIRSYPAPIRRTLVRELPELQTWACCELLCEESVRQAAHSTTIALDLALLALEVATLVRGSDAWRQRLAGYAWAFVANARRVANDLQGADAAWARVHELWAAGAAGDPAGVLDPVRLLDLEASLRRAQRRLPEALALLDRGLAQRSGGDPRARLLINKGKVLEELGDYPAAIATLEEAAPLLVTDSEPRLTWALHFNQADYHLHLGNAAAAADHFETAKTLAVPLTNHLDLVRMRAFSGRLAAARGRLGEALATFEIVRQEMAGLGLDYDSALFTIELAALLLEQGRTTEVKELARQCAPIFQAKGVHREARAALELFRRAAEDETASAVAARSLAAYLSSNRLHPELTFQT